WRCDKTKDIRAAIFDIFGEDWLVHINTTASADDICSFKQSRKTKKAFECYIYLDCLSNSKEITANTTKQIRLMELCKENDSNTSSNNSGDSESNYDQELEDNQELGDNQELEDNQELGIIKN
ncbi:5102_t:CDS:2, partial [Rhizophagus irregularis]